MIILVFGVIIGFTQYQRINSVVSVVMHRGENIILAASSDDGRDDDKLTRRDREQLKKLIESKM